MAEKQTPVALLLWIGLTSLQKKVHLMHNQCNWIEQQTKGAQPENRGKPKMEIQFFSVQNNSMSISFGKKLVTL